MIESGRNTSSPKHRPKTCTRSISNDLYRYRALSKGVLNLKNVFIEIIGVHLVVRLFPLEDWRDVKLTLCPDDALIFFERMDYATSTMGGVV